MSSYASSSSSSCPVPARCRSNAVSIQRPLLASSSSSRTPKLTLQIPALAQRAPACSRPTPRSSPPSSSDSSPESPPDSPPSPSYAPYAAAATSVTYTPACPAPQVSPQDAASAQRTQRAKLVAGILLSRHVPPRPACPWGALRAERPYVRTPLRAEVC